MQKSDASRDPGRKITARGLYRRISIIAVGYAFVVVIANTLLVIFGLDLTPRQLRFGFLAGVLTIPIVLLTDFLGAGLHARPIIRGLESIESGRVNTGVVQRALVRAFNLPLMTVLRIMTYHILASFIPATTLVLLWNRLFNAGFQTWHIITMWGSFSIAAVGHAFTEYYIILAEMQPVIPILQTYAGKLPAELSGRIVLLNVRQRQLALSIWMAFIPLVVVSFTTITRVNNLIADFNLPISLNPIIFWIAVLIAFVMTLSIFLANMLANHISRMTNDLVGAMRQVEAGDLDAYLAITTTDEYADLYQGFNGMVIGLRERERLYDAFGRYVSPELAEQIRNEGVTMTGQTLEASVMFVDIRDYTPMSERMEATEVVALLNDFFAQIEPAIKAEGGWINKFLGDGFMAVFGAPVCCEDHAVRAVKAALAIRSETDRLMPITLAQHCGLASGLTAARWSPGASAARIASSIR
jgi:HAMP domain-containing protein